MKNIAMNFQVRKKQNLVNLQDYREDRNEIAEIQRWICRLRDLFKRYKVYGDRYAFLEFMDCLDWPCSEEGIYCCEKAGIDPNDLCRLARAYREMLFY